MKKFYNWVVHHRKLILSLFLIMTAISLVCRNYVSVDYDMNDYLPQESASTTALDVMEKEYEGGIPNARVMVSDVTIPEALE